MTTYREQARRLALQLWLNCKAGSEFDQEMASDLITAALQAQGERVEELEQERDHLKNVFERHRGREKAMAEIVFQHIKHGDEQHQAWLREALVDALCREDTKACVTFDELRAKLTRAEAREREMMTFLANVPCSCAHSKLAAAEAFRVHASRTDLEPVAAIRELVGGMAAEFLREQNHGRVLVIAVLDQDDGWKGWVRTTTSQELFETRKWQAAVVIHADLLDAVRIAKERRTV
jgi:hypothetical protein